MPEWTIACAPPHSMTESQRHDVMSLVETVSDEFVPPLAGRASTTQSDLRGDTSADDTIRSYFSGLTAQWNLLGVTPTHGVSAIISYLPRRDDLTLLGQTPVSYISTVACLPEFRRFGIVRGLYAALIQGECRPKPYFPLATRTWSTNETHIPLLKSLGFVLARSLPNDRGVGIDTVYYIRM